MLVGALDGILDFPVALSSRLERVDSGKAVQRRRLFCMIAPLRSASWKTATSKAQAATLQP